MARGGCRSVAGRRSRRRRRRAGPRRGSEDPLSTRVKFRGVLGGLHRNSTDTCGHRGATADARTQRRRARPQQRDGAKDPVLQARVDADLAASGRRTRSRFACAWRSQTHPLEVCRTLPTRAARPFPALLSTSASVHSSRVSSPCGGAFSCSSSGSLADLARQADCGAARSGGWSQSSSDARAPSSSAYQGTGKAT